MMLNKGGMADNSSNLFMAGQNRANLATQQQPRIRMKPMESQIGEGGDQIINLQSAAVMLKRNTSEQQTAIERRFRAVKNCDNSAIMPRSGFSKGVSFVGSPDDSKMNDASTAFGNSVQKPSGMILDRRHLRTRGTDKVVSSSIDMKSPQNQNWRGIFSSMSGPNFANQLNLNQDLNFGSSPSAFTPRITSLQLTKQQSSSQDDQNPMAIWNRPTFSYTLSKTIMRPQYRGAASVKGSQSQYLDRMQKNKIEKLSRWEDEEKNRVKAKRAQLEALQTELEMIRLIGGTQGEQPMSKAQEDESQQIESPRSDNQSTKTSNKLMQKIQLEILRSDMENKGQLTSFAKSMTINSNFTHTGGNLTSTSQISEGKFLRTPALITNAPNLSNSVYQPYFLMTLEDDVIAANLQKMKADLETQLKDVEFKHKSEFFVYQKLDNQRIRERKELTSLTLRHRDKVPEQEKFERALDNIPRIQMLSLTAKEQTRNLLNERRKQLERRKEFYDEILEKKIRQLKVESKELDELKGAIGKRQKRVDEMKDNLAEIKQNNKEDEQKKQELIQSMLNKNLEFKVLSGLEIIVKLENALKGIDRLKEEQTAVQEKEGMDTIKSVAKNAVKVEMLTKEDLEVMNRQKIERLKVYESHFSQVFPDMKKIKINDEYMHKRYEDLSFSIHSLTCKYQELVINTNYKKKLIKQYLKFQEQVERDRQFFDQFQPARQTIDSIVLEEPEFAQNKGKKEKTLNDMRCAELSLRRSLLSQDIAVKSKIIAQTCTFVNSTLGKYSFVLREIFQIMRIEQTLPGRERMGPEQIPITEYLNPAFLQLLQIYASKFSLENLSSSASIGSMEKTKGNSKNGDRKEQSPQKKKVIQKTSISALNRQGTLQFSLKSLAPPPLSLQNSGQLSLRQSDTLRRKSQYQLNFGLQKSLNQSPLRNDSEKPDNETSASISTFDISLMTHLKDFFTVIVVRQQHLNIFKVLSSGQVPREFAYIFSKQYIMQHKILGKMCEVCQMTKQLGVNTAIYVNGLEFKQKYPKLGLAKGDQEGQKRKPYETADRNKVQNAGDLYEEDTETIVAEEDYVNPHSKHIVYDLLVSDRRREEAEQRRLKRDSEREKALAKMTEAERREQTLKRLQKQVNAIKAYEKDEHSFREQFKSNALEVFNGDLPQNRETKRYLLLEGQSMAQITAKTLKNQQDPYKQFSITLPAEKIALTTQAKLERQDHGDIHKRLFLSPNDMMRTLELKSRQKKSQQQQQSARTQANNTVHHDDEFTGGNFYTTQESFNKVGLTSESNGANHQFSKIQQRQAYTQRLIQKNLQRRTVVKIDKPEPKQSNVVLKMLQDKFPQLEKLFMDTAQRRAYKKQQLFQVRSGSLLSEGNSPAVKTFASPGLGSSPGDDETTQVAGTVGGYNSDDQFNSGGGGQQIGGFGTQPTIDDENSDSGVMQSYPLIKVKPVFPRGVFK